MLLSRLERKVLQHVQQNRLLPDRAGVIVGLSGGPDSVALLRLLHSLNAAGAIRVALSALHLNHLLRGRQARADEIFCVNLCKTLGLPITVKRLNVKRFARLHRLSTEEAARRVRYDVFRAAARKAPQKTIALALGHHAGDQAETVLQRIIRGTGITGLAGIPVKRPLDLGTPGKAAMIVRPLLATRRDEILAYLAKPHALIRATSACNS
jgi:tRNA(Ile)-lysidine synthase